MTPCPPAPDPEQGAILAVCKPEGPTSHDVVARVRREFGIQQVGHTGTLDPFATGLLLVCIGPATRLAEYLTGLPKRYSATMRLGETTDTDDLLGTVIAQSEQWGGLEEDAVRDALGAQVGTLEQLPPLFSAKRVGGERAHARARRGEPVERRAVPVTVHSIRLLDIRLPDVRFEVECGSGTYIRAIARDVGEALGTGAHLRALRRTRVGEHAVEDAVPLEQLSDPEARAAALLAPADALRHLPRVEVVASDADALRHGRRLPAPPHLPSGSPVVLAGPGGRLLAIAERIGEALQPRKVFA